MKRVPGHCDNGSRARRDFSFISFLSICFYKGELGESPLKPSREYEGENPSSVQLMP